MEQETKPCKYCDTTISAKAIYCNHCKHYQNWRVFKNFNNSLIALCIALISVLSSFIPIVKETFEDKKTVVTASFLETSDNAFVILLTNEGNKRGVISYSRIKLNSGKVMENKYMTANLANQSKTRIVNPKDYIELYLKPSESNKMVYGEFIYLLKHLHSDGKSSRQIASLDDNFLILGLIDHTGTVNELEVKIPEFEFKKWLNNLFPERNIPGIQP